MLYCMSRASSNTSTPSQASAEPVGSGEYVVRAGECIHSIAFEAGFFWETLWNHADNSEVKSARKNPSLLMEGDRLTVPPLTRGEESCATEAKHKFRRKGVPGKLVLILTRPAAEDQKTEGTDPDAEPTGESEDAESPEPKPQEPWEGAAWECTIDGTLSNGTTGADGKIELIISPAAREGKLVVDADKPTQRVITLNLGGLDPADSASGVMQRLRNLAFEPGVGAVPAPEDAAGQAQLRSAVEAFQAAQSLDTTGQIDQATIDKLKEIHGS